MSHNEYEEEGLSEFIQQASDESIKWARELIEHPDTWLILDTETTGLNGNDQVIQVAILHPSGKILLDQLIKPAIDIDPGAERVHHISAKTLENMPEFPIIYPRLVELLTANAKTIVAYNAAFDSRLLYQTCGHYGLAQAEIDWSCAMEAYAKYYGEYSSYHGSFRWQRLQGGDHSAAGDCRATLELIKRMASARLSTEKDIDSKPRLDTIKSLKHE